MCSSGCEGINKVCGRASHSARWIIFGLSSAVAGRRRVQSWPDDRTCQLPSPTLPRRMEKGKSVYFNPPSWRVPIRFLCLRFWTSCCCFERYIARRKWPCAGCLCGVPLQRRDGLPLFCGSSRAWQFVPASGFRRQGTYWRCPACIVDWLSYEYTSSPLQLPSERESHAIEATAPTRGWTARVVRAALGTEDNGTRLSYIIRRGVHVSIRIISIVRDDHFSGQVQKLPTRVTGQSAKGVVGHVRLVPRPEYSGGGFC